MVADVTFQVMGCRARVVVNGADHDGLAASAIERLEGIESLWSRFRSDSEISMLNQAGGEPRRVSPETLQLLDTALEAWEATGGAFDPTMLDELVQYGYDRHHAELRPADHPPCPGIGGQGPGLGRTSRCGEIMIDHRQSMVAFPPGVGFDPGGIGKGLAADLVATELLDRGADGAMVELGGDLRVIGLHPDHGPTWTVEVGPSELGVDGQRIGLADGGVATSSQALRRWSTETGDRHHLLDPRTGRPSNSPVAAAVVATGLAWQAEVVAKVALMAGFDTGADIIVDSGAMGVLFDFDGGAHDIGLLAAASPA